MVFFLGKSFASIGTLILMVNRLLLTHQWIAPLGLIFWIKSETFWLAFRSSGVLTLSFRECLFHIKCLNYMAPFITSLFVPRHSIFFSYEDLVFNHKSGSRFCAFKHHVPSWRSCIILLAPDMGGTLYVSFLYICVLL